MRGDQEPTIGLSVPDLVIEVGNFVEYKKRAEELVDQGYKFDRNIPKSKQDHLLSNTHGWFSQPQQNIKVKQHPSGEATFI